MRRPRPLDVAIVGMACRFAGFGDLFAFWQGLLDGRDATCEIPPGRWDPDVFCEPGSLAGDRLPHARGGYLPEPVPFDPSAFGIMPRTAEGGEPEQFLVLDATLAALADAGIDPATLDRGKVEVVVGRGNYFNRGNLTRLQHGRMVAQTVGLLAALHPEWSEDDLDDVRDALRASLPPFEAATIPGQLTNATAGRVADRLDLSGASFVVDAASASALVAVDLGARALAGRRADLAIVGAVYLEADVDFPLVFRQLGALSRSGRSRPFAADADGMLPGEGVGVVALKRLADAERDGDRVYAVLKGMGLASDGRGAGLAAPSAMGHARAMRRAYRRSGIDPATVGLVEGHGLGVPAADRAELRALRAIFPTAGPSGRALGAVSANIGHAMPAAGMAALIKAALALHHRVLPPTPHAERPHRLLRGESAPVSLNGKARPWVHGDRRSPRRAGVNAFGFAGINAHAILEEHTATADGVAPGALLSWDTEAVLLSAADRRALIDRIDTLRAWLRREPRVALKDLAATINAEPRGGCRLGLVAGSLEDLADRLRTAGERLADPGCRSLRDARGAYFQEEPLGTVGGLAFLFPGEGSQYPGMLADLCPHFPEVRALFDTSDRIAMESGDPVPPSVRLFGGGGDGRDPYANADVAVNVVLSSQWALYGLLRALKIAPDAVAGHSSGELLALAAAGALAADASLEDQLGRLGTVFRGMERSGAVPEARLVAVAADRDRARAACAACAPEVLVAVDNCPHQVILAGPDGAVRAVVERLKGEGVGVEDLPFGRAYHTPRFASAVGPVEQFFGELDLKRPTLRIYSCSIAGRMPDDPESIRRLAAGQWTRPVAFRDTVAAMFADGIRVFVDVGARGHLAGFVEDTLRGRAVLAIAANVPRRSGTSQLNHLVATLFAHHVPLDATFLHARRRPVLVDFDAPTSKSIPAPSLKIGFPEMSLPEELIRRLCSRQTPALEDSPYTDGGSQERSYDAMADYFQTMDAFLDAHREVMAGALDPSGEPFFDGGDALGFDLAVRNGNGMHPREEVARDADRQTPGPWAGEIHSHTSDEVTTRLVLDADGDPIAENHTLGGRRVSDVEPGRLGLPVLPFSVMAEMVAQVGALLAPEGTVLVGLRDVRAHRWVRFEEGPLALELRGRRVGDERGAVRVEIRNLSAEDSEPGRRGAPVFEGIAVFDGDRPEAPEEESWEIEDSFTSRFTAGSLYGEQWLFHGPALRALEDVGRVGMGGIEGVLRVLPREGLFRSGTRASLWTDPIVLDAFTHLLGCWGLDCLSDDGDVIFPLGMGSLEIFGDDPPEGTRVACRIAIEEVQRHRVRVAAQVVRPDGRVWMRIRGWDDWRFHWPSRYRDVFRAPNRVFVGEEIALGDPFTGVRAVWLEPPADMGRPVWRDVLEQIQLAPAERAALLAATARGPASRRAQRLWGRIAAKEAARRLWPGRDVFPGDLAIVADANGRPSLRDLAAPGRDDLPAVSIAHTEGVAVGLAAGDPAAKVGVDVEPIVERSADFEALAFTPDERAILDRIPPADRAEWVARLWCAKEAVAKATGRGLVAGPSSVLAIGVDPDSGVVALRLGRELAAACPELGGDRLVARTARRGGYAWAWTISGSGGADDGIHNR